MSQVAFYGEATVNAAFRGSGSCELPQFGDEGSEFGNDAVRQAADANLRGDLIRAEASAGGEGHVELDGCGHSTAPHGQAAVLVLARSGAGERERSGQTRVDHPRGGARK